MLYLQEKPIAELAFFVTTGHDHKSWDVQDVHECSKSFVSDWLFKKEMKKKCKETKNVIFVLVYVVQYLPKKCLVLIIFLSFSKVLFIYKIDFILFQHAKKYSHLNL